MICWEVLLYEMERLFGGCNGRGAEVPQGRKQSMPLFALERLNSVQSRPMRVCSTVHNSFHVYLIVSKYESRVYRR
jgi:hypothetical protein